MATESSAVISDSTRVTRATLACFMVALVGIAAHIARLRSVVGHELLLLPSVSVLPVDEAGRILLVRHADHDDGWGILGGAVEVGESPTAAAVREAREETGADGELSEVAWFTRAELTGLHLSAFARALLAATAWLPDLCA